MGVCIEISDELRKRLESLKPLINFFAGLSFDSDSQYFEFLLNLAIHKVLSDILSDPESRLDLIKMIFKEQPEIVVKNIISMLNEELEIPQERSKKSEAIHEAPMHT